MSDELRAAAKRLTSGKDTRVVYPRLGLLAVQVALTDAIAMAEAYLAEHRADDGELVTGDGYCLPVLLVPMIVSRFTAGTN